VIALQAPPHTADLRTVMWPSDLVHIPVGHTYILVLHHDVADPQEQSTSGAHFEASLVRLLALPLALVEASTSSIVSWRRWLGSPLLVLPCGRSMSCRVLPRGSVGMETLLAGPFAFVYVDVREIGLRQ
jgi:hypothetical protein